MRMGGNSGVNFEPTIFLDAHPEMSLAREEIFGPVLTTTLRFRDLDEAIRIANDTTRHMDCP